MYKSCPLSHLCSFYLDKKLPEELNCEEILKMLLEGTEVLKEDYLQFVDEFIDLDYKQVKVFNICFYNKKPLSIHYLHTQILTPVLTTK